MSQIAVYDALTGTVTKMVRLGLSGGELMLVVDSDEGDDLSHFVDISGPLPYWRERPDMVVSYENGVLTAPAATQWEALLAGTEVCLGSGSIGEAGALDVAFLDPGSYVLRMTLFPYRSAEITVHVAD